MVHYYFNEISHRFTWEWQLNTSSQSAKIGLQGKKVCLQRSSQFFQKNMGILLSILHPWRTAGFVQEGILPGQFAGRGHHVGGLLKLPSSPGPHQTGSNPTPSRLSLFSPMRSLRTEHACLRK